MTISRARVRRHLRATAKPNVAEVRKIAAQVQLRKAEMKTGTFTTSQSCVYNTGILDITDNLAPQGDGDQTREGDQITPTSFNLRSEIKWTTGADALSPVRLLIIQQNADADDTLGISTILATTQQGYVNTSPFVPDTRSLYHVLYDKVHNPPSGSGGTRACSKFFNIRTKKPHKITYNQGSATATIDGKIAMYFISNNGAGGDAPVYTCSARFNWKDL